MKIRLTIIAFSIFGLLGCSGGEDGGGGAAPSIVSAPAQLYTQSEEITPFRFTNNNGGGLLNCVSNLPLPEGLALKVTSDKSTCEISGTPTVTQTTVSYIITASNGSGSDKASISISVALAVPPVLATISEQTFTQNTAVNFVLENTGGIAITSCSADQLPDGLTVIINSDKTTCEITGAATTVQAATDSSITAVNPIGSSTVTLSIVVVVALPGLDDTATLRFGQNLAVTPTSINNSGGTLLTACSADTLPTGLVVAVSSDASTCEVTGTPTAVQAATVHTITATNSVGSNSAEVTIKIDEQVVMTLTAVQTRVFQFNWNTTTDVDHYNLFENADGVSGSLNIEVIASGVSTTNLNVSLAERINAQYTLQTCFTSDDSDCDDSDVVSVSTNLSEAAGFFKASNAEAGDQFGEALVISADGTTMAIGSHQEDSNATTIGGNEADNSAAEAGAVYVFSFSGTSWAQQAYIKASNAEAGDSFGQRLSISDDGNILAVSSFAEDSNAVLVDAIETDNSASASGAVYVFSRDVSVWTQDAYVKASNTEADDFFGSSVSLSGDGATLAVGALGEDSNATGVDGDEDDNSEAGSGAVFVYIKSGSRWVFQAYIKASNTETFDNFGIALALSEDGSTLAVGANQESSKATGVNGDETDNVRIKAGAVYVFARSDALWAQQAYIKASNSGQIDLFGEALSMSSDGNTLAVSASQEDSVATGIDGDQSDNTAAESGAVYVFTRINVTWLQQEYIKAENSEADDRFGHAVALSGDGNTLAISANQEDSNAAGVDGDAANNSTADSGAIYLFKRSDGNWTQKSYIKSASTQAGDLFGQSIGLTSDGSALAIGMNADDSNATGINGDATDNSVMNSGAAYLY